MPFIGPSAALIFAQTSEYDAPLSSVTVRSTTETSAVGTRKAMPVSTPLRSGRTWATALAAPVPEGMMLKHAPRPPRQSHRGAVDDLLRRRDGVDRRHEALGDAVIRG